LHTKGAKTGEERIHPVMYRKDDDKLVIFGSKGGAPKHPDWYWNLRANPEVKLEVGTKTIPAKARVAQGEERERIWSLQKKEFPMFAQYEAKTTRQIPVIVLEPLKT
ncbi:MAG: nitroreductase family deazaflavin-dependent oxidoreductase, partial [Acidimicrobiia bacterium]